MMKREQDTRERQWAEANHEQKKALLVQWTEEDAQVFPSTTPDTYNTDFMTTGGEVIDLGNTTIVNTPTPPMPPRGVSNFIDSFLRDLNPHLGKPEVTVAQLLTRPRKPHKPKRLGAWQAKKPRNR